MRLGHSVFWGTSWKCCLLLGIHVLSKFTSHVILAGTLFATLTTGRRRGQTLLLSDNMTISTDANGSMSLSARAVDMRTQLVNRVRGIFVLILSTGEHITLLPETSGSMLTGMTFKHTIGQHSPLWARLVSLSSPSKSKTPPNQMDALQKFLKDGQLTVVLAAFDTITGPTEAKRNYQNQNIIFSDGWSESKTHLSKSDTVVFEIDYSRFSPKILPPTQDNSMVV